MFVWATRTASAFALRALFYVGLFLFVVALHVGVTTSLRAFGWNGGASLFVSGVIVLVVVLGANFIAGRLHARRAAAHEAERARLGLPDGPCCVVWRAAAPGQEAAAMPWDLTAPLRAAYPPLAKRFGIEGVAIVDFEIGADGAPRHIACIDAWPSDIFYDAAAAALRQAHFVVRPGETARFGASYRMPFVFRIAGAAHLKEAGRRALPHRPFVLGAVKAAELAAGWAAERIAKRA